MKSLKDFENIKSFTPKEAWNIFRFIALAEAFGWTILILGLLIQKYKFFGYIYAVPIAGQIHGTIFLAYFTVIFFVYSSLNWNRITTLFALAAGVVPYGSLIFELSISKKMSGVVDDKNRVYLVYRKGKHLLAMLPANGIDWVLPGIPLKSNESKLQGINRLLNTFFNKILSDAQLREIDSIDGSYYYLVNNKALDKIDLSKATVNNPYADEFAFIKPDDAPKLKQYFSERL